MCVVRQQRLAHYLSATSVIRGAAAPAVTLVVQVSYACFQTWFPLLCVWRLSAVRVRGAANEQNKVLKDDLQAQQKTTTFYKKMAEHETDDINDRADLTNRLRDSGL